MFTVLLCKISLPIDCSDKSLISSEPPFLTMEKKRDAELERIDFVGLGCSNALRSLESPVFRAGP